MVPINFLVHQATLAVKEGLDRETALRAITINPARVLGLDGPVGSVAVGKDADLVLWSGDPLDVMQRARRVFIGGREVYHYDDTASVGRRHPALTGSTDQRSASRPTRRAPSTNGICSGNLAHAATRYHRGLRPDRSAMRHVGREDGGEQSGGDGSAEPAARRVGKHARRRRVRRRR